MWNSCKCTKMAFQTGAVVDYKHFNKGVLLAAEMEELNGALYSVNEPRSNLINAY